MILFHCSVNGVSAAFPLKIQTARVVCKTESDAKSRGRSKNQVKNWKKLYYINGGTQERKFNFVKNILNSFINGGTQEWKFYFVKNILNSFINGNAQE